MTEDKDFYSPSEISFKREQVVWLLKHLNLIYDGFWPSEHKESGYTGKKKQRISSRGYFEKPAEVAAELKHRIERVGIDAVLLAFVYAVDPADKLQLEYHLAQAMRLEQRDIERRIETALRYTIGKCRKSRSCDNCPEKDCKRRGRNARTYRQFRLHQKGQPQVDR